jgi:hypothetical protein
MLRRASLGCALFMLLLAPACRKETEEVDERRAKKENQTTAQPQKTDQVQPTPTPTTPEPTPSTDSGATKADSGGAGSGGSGGGAPAPREDLTCDPSEKGGCLEGEQCIGGQGCDAVWTCDAQIVCKKGVQEYCGCDGRTFEAVFGNCPWKKYEYPGPCK